jgi:RNA recognition motif-containing protein
MNIYVGNLSLETTDDDIREEFSVFGQVKSVKVMNDKDIGSGQSNGYGYVEMASDPEGNAAVTGLRGKTIRGMVIQVIESLGFSGHADKNSYDSRRSGRFNRKIQRSGRKKLNNFFRN